MRSCNNYRDTFQLILLFVSLFTCQFVYQCQEPRCIDAAHSVYYILQLIFVISCFYFFYSNTWSFYLTELVLVGAVGARINVSSSYSQ